MPALPRRTDEAGFSLIELMVAMAVIGIVMSALATFFTTAISVTNAQGNSQTAIQLVNDALERVHAVKGSALSTGRDQASTTAQWTAASSAVTPYLATMVRAYDTAATPTSIPALPTSAQTVTINKVPFAQSWYVGQCWQPLLGGDCTPDQASGAVPFYRVVAAVTWTGLQCPPTGCVQLASTLVSNVDSEPLFNSNQTAAIPKLVNPGRQDGELTVPVNLTVTATSGAPPLLWAATGLPAGLSMNSSGAITGTPTTAGSYSPMVTVTDGFNLIGSATFPWLIASAPVLTTPGPQNGESGVAITSVTPVLAGGVSPLTWQATGLPPGLSIDATTGTITGTPTTAGTYPTTVTVTDTYGKTASTAAFTWTVIVGPTITTPIGNRSNTRSAITPFAPAGSGGSGGNTWTATGLPTGISMNPSTGQVSGTPTTVGTNTVTITLTDSNGAKSTSTCTWTIT